MRGGLKRRLMIQKISRKILGKYIYTRQRPAAPIVPIGGMSVCRLFPQPSQPLLRIVNFREAGISVNSEAEKL